MTDKPEKPRRKFYVAKIGKDGKIERILERQGQLSFEEAKALAQLMTCKYEPVAVTHYDWLQERRAG